MGLQYVLGFIVNCKDISPLLCLLPGIQKRVSVVDPDCCICQRRNYGLFSLDKVT